MILIYNIDISWISVFDDMIIDNLYKKHYVNMEHKLSINKDRNNYNKATIKVSQ